MTLPKKPRRPPLLKKVEPQPENYWSWDTIHTVRGHSFHNEDLTPFIALYEPGDRFYLTQSFSYRGSDSVDVFLERKAEFESEDYEYAKAEFEVKNEAYQEKLRIYQLAMEQYEIDLAAAQAEDAIAAEEAEKLELERLKAKYE